MLPLLVNTSSEYAISCDVLCTITFHEHWYTLSSSIVVLHTHIILSYFANRHTIHSTAGRMVKTGLTASVIVSQWTWAATLLQSSNVAWQYGVSGPFW